MGPTRSGPPRLLVVQPAIRDTREFAAGRVKHVMAAVLEGVSEGPDAELAETYVRWMAEHVPGMRRLKTHAKAADVVHLQWLSVPDLDRFLLPPRPRAFTVQCKVLPGKISMTYNLDRKPDLTVVLDRSNVELMRQIMLAYSKDLIDLDA